MVVLCAAAALMIVAAVNATSGNLPLAAMGSNAPPPVSIAPAGEHLESAPLATVSGTIRRADNGNPVSGVTVHVIWSSGKQSVTSGPSGVYSAGGVPTGGPVQILVRPAVAAGLAFRNWRTSALTGSLVMDFNLKNGYRVQGEFQQPDGPPYAESSYLWVSAMDFEPLAGEWMGDMATNGQFDLVLPAGHIYILDTSARPFPYYMPFIKLHLTGDVTGLVITLLDKMPAPFPTAPPRASAITVGAPDPEGYATISGAAGAVEPLSAVVLVNLSSRSIVTATSDESGAFGAELYAPPGSSLLVKYDRTGERVNQIWEDALQSITPDISYASVLPGTILRVGEQATAGETTPFYSVGSFYTENPNGWAGWALDGALHLPPGTGVGQGDGIDYHARIRITSPAITCTEPLTYTTRMNVMLRYLFDSDGQSDPWAIWFNAHLFTPTFLPIEHEARGELVILNWASFGGLTCISPHAFEGTLESRFTVPHDLPDGIYLVEAFIDRGGVPRALGVPMIPVWYHPSPVASLPPITVGSTAPPHIPWTLLGDYPVNGHRGLQAREDIGRFAMPTRVVYPPHQVIVPRVDERSGEPLVYRLEPGSHWLSGNDRRVPNPPHIPLKLPSGELYVEVHKPDGSTDVLGPAIVRQSSVRTPTTPGGAYLDFGSGHICDLYHLTTMDEAFAYSFEQYGPHVITLAGGVEDVYGNTYAIEGTYELTIARVLDLDPAQLPTTPYVEEDAFAPGMHIFPPVPAEVEVRLVQMPYSDPAQAITTTIHGQANRFGYFQPQAGTIVTMVAPGEFRVDVTAVYPAPDGTLWAGAMTWGNVVEGHGASIIAHGRRGMDYKDNTIADMPAWFEVLDLEKNHPSKVQGAFEVYYPYFSGDVHWGDETPGRVLGDSIHTIISIEEVGGIDGPIYNLMRSKWPARNGFRWPPVDQSLAGLEKRLQVQEAPLFITTDTGIDPAVDPEAIDLWGYWYGSSERPDVHVREIISEDNMGTAYWRFDDTYAYQIGEGAKGDLPGDIKWEFGGAVFRYLSPTDPINEYAIYSSLWVLLPHYDAVGARITPPFQDGLPGVSINGGPIMVLGDQEIDMLFLPKGVRPGDVLEVGDVIAFSGHVGPPLDSLVSVTVTSPSGIRNPALLRANKIGWVHDPEWQMEAFEPGRWTVDVALLHDRPLSYAAAPTSHNTGTVLGTEGRYEFYVVEPGSPRLFLRSPEPGFITWPAGEVEPIHIEGSAPAGTTAVHYTIHDKGVVMGQDVAYPDDRGIFTVTYDAEALNAAFPFVSLTAHEGEWEGLADEVAINLLAVGEIEPTGNTVTLIGEEVFITNDVQGVYLPMVFNQL